MSVQSVLGQKSFSSRDAIKSLDGCKEPQVVSEHTPPCISKRQNTIFGFDLLIRAMVIDWRRSLSAVAGMEELEPDDAANEEWVA